MCWAEFAENVEDKKIKILFAAGGTGGHLFPALAVADEIRKIHSGTEILFVGTKKRIESRLVPQKGYAFRTIMISRFHRSFRVSNLLFPLKVVIGLLQSFIVIRMFKPDVVFGSGGYVAGPVLFAAAMLGIPTVVHESNSYPGVTTKLLSSRATKVFITFDATKRWLKRLDNVEVVGNPTRWELGTVSREEAARFFCIDPKKKTVLVFGGSLGAASLNRAISGIARELTVAGIQLIWQTGERDFGTIISSHALLTQRSGEFQSAWIGAFIDRMELAYAAADIVMCRAGATTLAELTRLGKPAILVPYPHAAANHQVINAQKLVDAGAAEVILDKEVQSAVKEKILRLISDNGAQKSMSENSITLGKPEAGKEIAQKILALVS